MVVVGLRGGEEWEVVTTVDECGAEEGNDVPQPSRGQVGSNQDWAEGEGSQVDKVVFQWVAVESSHRTWCCPVMVVLVDMLVEESNTVEKSIWV